MDRNFGANASTATPPLQSAISAACETMSSLGSLEARLESLHDKLFGSRAKEASNSTDAPPPSGDMRVLRAIAEQHHQRIHRLDRLIDEIFNGLS